MRKFELQEGTSSKFWSAGAEGAVLVVRFGRIGTQGQEKRKELGSPAAAAAELAKLVVEKTKKGYVEVDDAARGAAPAPNAAAAVKAKVATRGGRAAARPKVTPTRAPRGTVPVADGFAFTPALDALFARGFPHLFVLTEPEPGGEQRDRKLALEALEAIDPVFPVVVSRRAASRFLRAYVAGKTWQGLDPKTGEGIPIQARVAARDAALARDEPVTVEVLEAILTAQLPHGDETYPFRVMHAIRLAEASLGTEVVLRRVVAHLVRVGKDHALWGGRGDAGRMNNHANFAAAELGWMRRRLDEDAWRAAVAPLRGATAPALVAHAALIEAVLDDARAAPPTFAATLASQRRDGGGLVEALGKVAWWPSVDAFYVVGADWLAAMPHKQLPRSPKWQARRMVDELGTIRHPETARAIAWLMQSRGARDVAEAWLREHADLARPVLVGMAASAAEAKVGADALAVLGGGEQATEARELTEAEVEAEVARVFATLQRRLDAAKGQSKKERAAFEAALSAYSEARASGGDPIPEAYFTHNLDRLRGAEPALSRWIEMAVEVASE